LRKFDHPFVVRARKPRQLQASPISIPGTGSNQRSRCLSTDTQGYYFGFG